MTCASRAAIKRRWRLPVCIALRNEVAGAQIGDRARMEAWIAIRKLYDAFKAAPDRDLTPLWQDAISKTVTWVESLR